MQQLFWKKVEIENRTHGRVPKVEEGCQITYMIDKNKYILTGGIKHRYNIKDLQPKKESQQQETGGLSINFKIGAAKAQPDGSVNQDYVYIYSPGDNQWTIHQTSGRIPIRRIFHHVWYEAPHLFMYGGMNKDNKTLNDTYMLNTETFQWKRFFYLEGPPPRLHQGFCSDGSRNYVIGGGSMPENLLLNDIWYFSFENVAWESQSLELPGVIWQKVDVKEGAKLLPPIKGHSTIALREGSLFIYGGYDQSQQSTDISLEFDTEDESIRIYETKGQGPGPRAYHSVVMVKQDLICMFGGVTGSEQEQSKNPNLLNDLYLLNLNERYWSTPIVGGYIPAPRFWFAIAGNQNELYGELLVLGGRMNDPNQEQTLFILHELDMDHGEAWDERDDEVKNQFSSYRDAVKKDKRTAESNIHLLTLEFNEAEKIMLDQKKLMGDKEREFKRVQAEADLLGAQQQVEQERIEQARQLLEEDLIKIREDAASKNEKASEEQDFIDKIKYLLALERKKRKLAQRKVNNLQEAFRRAENFIITLDQFYCRGMKDDVFSGNIHDDVLGKIEKVKQEHRQILTQFRSDFETSYKREQIVRNEYKANKATLKPFENISKIQKSLHSKEDNEYFEKSKL